MGQCDSDDETTHTQPTLKFNFKGGEGSSAKLCLDLDPETCLTDATGYTDATRTNPGHRHPLHTTTSKPVEIQHLSSGSVIIGDLKFTPVGVSSDPTNPVPRISRTDLEVHGSLGQGASGSVTKCLYKPTKMFIALKRIDLSVEQNKKQIISESRSLLQETQSPYIVRYFNAFVEDNTSINIALEYMDRGSLQSIVTKIQPLPEQCLREVARQMVLGLQYMHEHLKIIHRDIKPGNVLVNSDGSVKIADFGITREAKNDELMQATFVGTTVYMSPERIMSQPYAFSCDIWSLGLTLVFCALGSIPFKYNKSKSDYWAVLTEMTQGTKITLRDQYARDGQPFSEEIIDFVDKCLCHDPLDRATARDLSMHPFVTGSLGKEATLPYWPAALSMTGANRRRADTTQHSSSYPQNYQPTARHSLSSNTHTGASNLTEMFLNPYTEQQTAPYTATTAPYTATAPHTGADSTEIAPYNTKYNRMDQIPASQQQQQQQQQQQRQFALQGQGQAQGHMNPPNQYHGYAPQQPGGFQSYHQPQTQSTHQQPSYSQYQQPAQPHYSSSQHSYNQQYNYPSTGHGHHGHGHGHMQSMQSMQPMQPMQSMSHQPSVTSPQPGRMSNAYVLGNEAADISSRSNLYNAQKPLVYKPGQAIPPAPPAFPPATGNGNGNGAAAPRPSGFAPPTSSHVSGSPDVDELEGDFFSQFTLRSSSVDQTNDSKNTSSGSPPDLRMGNPGQRSMPSAGPGPVTSTSRPSTMQPSAGPGMKLKPGPTNGPGASTMNGGNRTTAPNAFSSSKQPMTTPMTSKTQVPTSKRP